MTKPNVCGYDCETGEITNREMTDEEYADLLASGWQETNPDDEAQA
jgi:hypothetical protein